MRTRKMVVLTLNVLFLFASHLPSGLLAYHTHFDDLINGQQFMGQPDSFNGRSDSSRGCWLRGGICIKLDDCLNHIYYVTAPDCITSDKVCCMSSNFREVKNYADIGLKNALPWKKIRRNATRRPTAAEMETHLNNLKYYLMIFNINIDQTKIGQTNVIDSGNPFQDVSSNEMEEHSD